MTVFDYPRMLFKMLFSPKIEKVFYFPEIGWTIIIPGKFELTAGKEWLAEDKKYTTSTTVKNDIAIKQIGAEKHFSAVFELENTFSFTLTNFDITSEAEWKRKSDNLCNETLKNYYAAYKDFAHVKIDTEQDRRQRDNTVFETFDIMAATPEREINRTKFYTTTCRGNGILIIMNYTNPKVGEEMLDILRKSTFS